MLLLCVSFEFLCSTQQPHPGIHLFLNSSGKYAVRTSIAYIIALVLLKSKENVSMGCEQGLQFYNERLVRNLHCWVMSRHTRIIQFRRLLWCFAIVVTQRLKQIPIRLASWYYLCTEFCVCSRYKVVFGGGVVGRLFGNVF